MLTPQLANLQSRFTSMASNKETAKLSYEEARDELVSVVATLEAGGTSLEESLTLWQRGEDLAKICQEWLDGAREKLAAIKPN